jgi:hypothetical protein
LTFSFFPLEDSCVDRLHEDRAASRPEAVTRYTIEVRRQLVTRRSVVVKPENAIHLQCQENRPMHKTTPGSLLFPVYKLPLTAAETFSAKYCRRIAKRRSVSLHAYLSDTKSHLDVLRVEGSHRYTT